ncbi:MAG: hypothetical protein Kow00107_03630 [Planctomycetota bacterium]
MAISFKCPHCKVKMSLPDKFAGAQAACPACGKPIQIPGQTPTQQLKQGGQVGAELSDWYRRMTGEDAAAKKSALDELHRDTNVDVSEVVTRWDEDDYSEETETSRSGRREIPVDSPTRSSSSRRAIEQRGRGDRPSARRSRDDYEGTGNNGLIIAAVVALIVVVGGIGAFFALSGGDNPQPTATPAVGNSSEPTPVPSGTETAAGTSAEPSPEVSKTPEKTLSLEEMAQKYLEYGNDSKARLAYEEAADYFLKYLEVNPKDSEVWMKVIECYENLRKPDKVSECIDKALAALGDVKELYAKKADILTQKEDYDNAFVAYDKLLTLVGVDEKQSILEEVFLLATTAGTNRSSKPYLDKAYEYLKQLKDLVDSETYEMYKQGLADAYQQIGQQAPF